jgi:hypothetical protein
MPICNQLLMYGWGFGVMSHGGQDCFLGAPQWLRRSGDAQRGCRIVSGSSRLAAIVSRIFRVLAESIGMPVQTADVRYQPTEATDIPWFFPLMRI